MRPASFDTAGATPRRKPRSQSPESSRMFRPPGFARTSHPRVNTAAPCRNRTPRPIVRQAALDDHRQFRTRRPWYSTTVVDPALDDRS